jgi:hypothetical protein
MTEGQASGAAIAFEQVEKGFGDRKVLDNVSSPSLGEKQSASWAEAGPAKV